jgi:hypothetical protein
MFEASTFIKIDVACVAPRVTFRPESHLSLFSPRVKHDLRVFSELITWLCLGRYRNCGCMIEGIK